MKRELLLLVSLFGLMPVCASAEESGTVTVVDCQSMPRAASPAPEVKAVELQFSGEISKASLTEIGSKEKLEVALQKGVAVFEGVRAGTWSACQAGDVQAVAINLKTGTSGVVVGALSAAGLAGGALAIGSGSDGGSALVEDSSTATSPNREALVFNTDEGVPSGYKEPVVEDRPSGKDKGDCTVSMAAVGGCRENELPAPLSPFS